MAFAPARPTARKPVHIVPALKNLNGLGRVLKNKIGGALEFDEIPIATMGLLSLSRCISKPLIECLWMQCRFWRAGLPTWHVRALLLVKESGNLPHSGEAADKLDEAGPWAVPRISSRRLRSRVR